MLGNSTPLRSKFRTMSARPKKNFSMPLATLQCGRGREMSRCGAPLRAVAACWRQQQQQGGMVFCGRHAPLFPRAVRLGRRRRRRQRPRGRDDAGRRTAGKRGAWSTPGQRPATRGRVVLPPRGTPVQGAAAAG
jgi:hypothetical protein